MKENRFHNVLSFYDLFSHPKDHYDYDNSSSDNGSSYYGKRDTGNMLNGSIHNDSHIGDDYYEDYYDNFCGCDILCNIIFNFDYIGRADGSIDGDYFYSCKYFHNPSYPNETCEEYVEYSDYEDFEYYEYYEYYEEYGNIEYATMMTTSVMTVILNTVSEFLKQLYFIGTYFNNLFN